jgi:hypothetical protein
MKSSTIKKMLLGDTSGWDSRIFPRMSYGNGTARFKKCKQLFKYQNLLSLRDIWQSLF